MKDVIAFVIAAVVAFACFYAEQQHVSEHAEYSYGFGHEEYCAVAP